MRRFRLQSMPEDFWVIDDDTNQPLGYFFPSRPGEVYAETFEPEQLVNLAEFPEHQDIKFFAILYFNLEPEWEQLGFSVSEALSWKKWNIDPAEAGLWHALGMDFDARRPWRERECDAAETKQWLDEGFAEPKSNPWLKARIHYAEAKEWMLAGFDPEATLAWRKGNFDVAGARSWIDVGLETPGEASLWRDHKKLTPEQFTAWVQPWEAAGFNYGAALRWQDEYQVTDPNDAKILAKLPSNIDWDVVQAWREYGYTMKQMDEHLEHNYKNPFPPEHYAEQKAEQKKD